MYILAFILIAFSIILFTTAQGGKPAIVLILTLSTFILLCYLIGSYSTVNITTPNIYRY